MEPQGLAQQGAQQGPGQPQGMNQEQMMALVQQVVKLLMQGVTPQELIAKGVPQQVIDEALKLIDQHRQATGQDTPQAPQNEQGLAGRV